MKRLFHALPWLGLALIALALLFRGLREEGLGLRAFPAPPDVLMGAFNVEAPNARLAGFLRDPQGLAIAEALVLSSFDGELAWTYSDVQGHFVLEHLPAGPLQLEVVARKFRTERYPLIAPDEELELVMDEPVGEVPALPPLTRSDLEGRVVSSIGRRGLLGYQVLLLPAQPVHEFGQPVPVRAEVGADRGFHFEDLIQGEYRVVILPPWARAGSWPNLCAATARSYTHGPASAELELPMGAGEIHGRVLDAHGLPVVGALVVLTPEADADRIWPPSSSDEAGFFELRDLPPGRYRLDLRAGEAGWRETVQVLAGHTSVLDLPPLDVRRRR